MLSLHDALPISAKTPMPRWRQRCERRQQRTTGVEQFLRPVTLKPLLQLRQMHGLLEMAQWHLVGAPGALNLLTVDESRTGPALWRAQHQHRPQWPLQFMSRVRTSRTLDFADLEQHAVQDHRQLLMISLRLIAFDKIGNVAITVQ